jgi:hypothetical protein
MRASGWVVAAGLILAGCASAPAKPDAKQKSASAKAPATGDALRFVDASLGFEISRPDDSWSFEQGGEAPPGLAMPVVISHKGSGAQVVVQVAPDVAPPDDFAQRLAVGLQSKPGFSTTTPEMNEDGRASFLFKLGDEVFGKVNVVGAPQRLFVLLATWPADAPQDVVQDIDGILHSLQTTQGVAAQSAAVKLNCPPGRCLKL